VIQYLDAEYISSFEKALGYHQVICAWIEDAAGMVVCHDDCSRPLSQRVRKDPPSMRSGRDNEIHNSN